MSKWVTAGGTFESEAEAQAFTARRLPNRRRALSLHSTKVRARYLICQACVQGRENGHACVLHSGCCFGALRAKIDSACPAGKW
jgi:hypothetical protein